VIPPDERLGPAGRLSRVRQARRAVSENVRALGWVSLANDAASELAYPIVPLFLTVTLGAPVAVLGLIEGVAEGVAVGLRGAAGWLSDRAGGRRRPWIVSGYSLSALSRPVLAAAPAWGFVLIARLADRWARRCARRRGTRSSVTPARPSSLGRASATTGLSTRPAPWRGRSLLSFSWRPASLCAASSSLPWCPPWRRCSF